MKKSGIFSAGIAMFTMMFGAGNIIFPLALGKDAGDGVLFAIAGFCLTAVLVPLLGIVSMSLYHGDYKKFLGTIGAVPGAFVALLCMILIGPFGCIPRCITVSHAAIKWYFPQMSLLIFSIMATMLIFVATFYKSSVVNVLGRFLGPVKIGLLMLIMLMGLFSGAALLQTSTVPVDAFVKGMFEGYVTMDLLAAIFFSGLICAALQGDSQEKSSQLVVKCLKAGMIGGLLLAIVYSGFCLVAAFNAQQVHGIDKAQLLSALASMVLGGVGGILANITVALSCLTTAIALTTVFGDYLNKELTGGRVPYKIAIGITTLLSCIMTNFGFSGIMALVQPIIVVCYPALIVLALVNIAHKIIGFKQVKIPVFITLLAFLCLQWW